MTTRDILKRDTKTQKEFLTMYQSFLEHGRLLPVRLTRDELTLISREPVRALFSPNERALIDVAENDPALRSFLDRAFSSVEGLPIEIPLREEFRKFPPSEQAALEKAVHHRIVLRKYIFNSYSVIRKLPPPSYTKH